jgi:hypothetical protein
VLVAVPNKLDDLGEALWISQNTSTVEPKVEEWKGNFVSHCVPTVYSAYCKIFHPIYEDLSIEDRDLTWDDLNRQRSRNLDDHIEKLLADATTIYGGQYDRKHLKKITWRELADQKGLKFHAELNVESFTRNFPGRSWPRYLIGPAEGDLDTSTLKEIVRSIATTTSDFKLSQPCYFHYDDITTETFESDLLFHGKLLDIFDTPLLEDVNTTPTHWWAADREWFVMSDWDLTFTLIGGSIDLINSLIWNSEIDCVRVTPTTRIDYKSDQINP